MLKIYHNPRCAKSRAGLNYLKDNQVTFEVVEYLKSPLTAEQVKNIIEKTGQPVTEFVRKQEDYYKKNLKGKDLLDKEWYKILAENPKLLQRPIVMSNSKAVLAQPPEKIKELI